MLCLQSQLEHKSQWLQENQGILSARYLHRWPLDMWACQTLSDLAKMKTGSRKVRKTICWLAEQHHSCPLQEKLPSAIVMIILQPPLVPRRPEPPDMLGSVRDTAGDSPSWAEEHRGEITSFQFTHGETEARSGWDRPDISYWKCVPQALP